ncbi:Crp/Fnr family transcriptional regulator [uncultured Jannaschia sp.]|uniref:Crp/Fnr family transcriptional regulator n=1 Tax=uncultured Jannaschia sp. TaxID=293347 RepID=UPI00262F1EBB|nr:Crp/Fnr family transcriptional regulator [uncultured Jannaschia sp.]
MKHLIRKLEHFAPLSQADRCKLEDIGGRTETFEADRDLVAEGERPRSVFVLTSGMAFRYKLSQDGRRQILTFLLPGDICDLHVFLLKEMDHSIGTLMRTTVSAIATEDILGMFFDYPRITAALWWSMLQEEAILRERIVALGTRDARSRVAYLLCEILWRMEAVGRTDGTALRLPLTQQELGEALRLTPSYVNRLLQELRRQNLISWSGGVLDVTDPAGLIKMAGFDPSYLHLEGAPEEIQRHFAEMESQE